MIEFYYDRLVSPTVGYPNLAVEHASPNTASWQNLDHTWPRCVPLRLLMYFDWQAIPYKIVTANTITNRAWYPIGLAWFDHNIDYFDLMSEQAILLLQNQKLKVLFYYHEGDNPFKIKQRIDALVSKHCLPKDSYLFISANTVARQCNNFLYVPDHELFFNYTNRYQSPGYIKLNRAKTFTALNRLHKWWRATAMTDLLHKNLLDNSLWSYNTANDLGDEPDTNNPIQFDWMLDWRDRTHAFVNNSPYYCDQLTEQQHNSHNLVNLTLYNQSWCHIVFETYFDVDQSGGAFITEKTFKPIKFGQPFVIVGPQGTLAELRNMGYKTFDNVIDNSYDSIEDNSQRWFAIIRALQRIKHCPDKHLWFSSCVSDLVHNQQMFSNRTTTTLNNITEDLKCRLE